MILLFIVVTALLVGLVVGVPTWLERRHQLGDAAKRQLGRIDTAHDEHELVDIRSNAFAENELVATLCITCDKQLGPEVWQAKMTRELAALEAPRKTLQAENAELRAKTDELASAVYVQVVPDTELVRRQVKNYPNGSWSADQYRRRGWKPQFAESNFDHGKDRYVLPFFNEQSVTRLEFHSAAAAHGWWRSSVPYEKYDQHRKAIERVNDGLRFDAEILAPQVDAVTRAMEHHTKQISRTYGVPLDRVERDEPEWPGRML